MTTMNATATLPKENLYRVLKVDAKAAIDDIKKAINKELRLWSQRQNAPQIERRQEAERMVKVLESAESILLNPSQRAEYDKVLRTTPPPMPTQTGDVPADGNFSAQARRLLADGSIDEARYVAQRATEKEPGNAEAWAVLGYTKGRLGKYDDAIYELRRAIQLNPNEPAYYADLAFVYQDVDKYADALQAYQNAFRIDPSPFYRAGLGWLLVRNGMLDQGLAELETAVKEAPDDQYLQEHLARALVLNATKDWTEIGDDKYPTEFRHIAHAQALVGRALTLKFDDDDLRHQIQSIHTGIAAATKRHFTGNWFAAIVTALIGIPLLFIPTLFAILYVISAFAPEYKINQRVAKGKTAGDFALAGKISGRREETGDAVEDISNSLIKLVVIFAVTVILMPFVTLINFYRNYISK